MKIEQASLTLAEYGKNFIKSLGEQIKTMGHVNILYMYA